MKNKSRIFIIILVISLIEIIIFSTLFAVTNYATTMAASISFFSIHVIVIIFLWVSMKSLTSKIKSTRYGNVIKSSHYHIIDNTINTEIKDVGMNEFIYSVKKYYLSLISYWSFNIVITLILLIISLFK